MLMRTVALCCFHVLRHIKCYCNHTITWQSKHMVGGRVVCNMHRYSLISDATSFKQLAQSNCSFMCSYTMYWQYLHHILFTHNNGNALCIHLVLWMNDPHSSSCVVDAQAKDVMLAKEGIAQWFEHEHLWICMWGILISLKQNTMKTRS